MSHERVISVDGRRARRDQNRERVVDALLDLYRDGDLQPSVAAVAERSGVSHRSVFRYFEDLDQLYRVAIERHYDAVSALMRLSAIGEGTLDDRIDRIVENRVALYEAVAPVARVARMRAPSEPVLEDHRREMAVLGLQQVRTHFAPELEALPEDGARATAEVAAGLLSMDSLEYFCHTRGMTSEAAATVIAMALRGVFGTDGGRA